MTMRAVVERAAPAAANGWNLDPAPTWQTHLAELPCRLWYANGGETIDGDKTAVIEGWRMIVPAGTDIAESDRIASVVDRRGRTIHAGPLNIETVGRRADHVPLTLQEVSS